MINIFHHCCYDTDAGAAQHDYISDLIHACVNPKLYSLVQVQPSMARELFAAGFVSCWAELEEGMREALVRSLEAALASPSIPAEIVTTLLNLAEFMEHNEKKLPLDTRRVFSLNCDEHLLLLRASPSRSSCQIPWSTLRSSCP